MPAFDMQGVDTQHTQMGNHEIESLCHGMGCSRSSWVTPRMAARRG